MTTREKASSLCARGGCTAEATGKYCTRRCAAVARIGAGWHPEASLLRPDVRRRACRNGALACAKVRRRQRIKALDARLTPLLNHRCFSDLDAEGRAAVLVVARKAFKIGLSAGYQRGYSAKPTPAISHAKQGQRKVA